MEEQANAIESLIDKTKEFGKTSLKLGKLIVFDKTSDVISSVIPIYLVVVFLFTFLLFLNLGLALWLGEIFGSAFYGFFAVAGLYVLLGVLLNYVFYTPVKKSIQKFIVKKFLK